MSDLCADLASTLTPTAEILRIAVAHGQVDALAPDASRPEIIDLASAERAIAAKKFHYLALGDRHSLTAVGDTGRVWYSGAPVATAFDETDPNQALLVDLELSGGCAVQPLDVGAWSFLAAQRAMNGPDDVAQLRRWLSELPNKERTAIKIGFEGAINLATAAALDEVMESSAALFASLKRRERTTALAILPDELDQDSVALAGYARHAWDELLEKAGAHDQLAQDALRLFYRLINQGAS
jgi:hypothetical protein